MRPTIAAVIDANILVDCRRLRAVARMVLHDRLVRALLGRSADNNRFGL
jgi:hypothetical protein